MLSAFVWQSSREQQILRKWKEQQQNNPKSGTEAYRASRADHVLFVFSPAGSGKKPYTYSNKLRPLQVRPYIWVIRASSGDSLPSFKLRLQEHFRSGTGCGFPLCSVLSLLERGTLLPLWFLCGTGRRWRRLL